MMGDDEDAWMEIKVPSVTSPINGLTNVSVLSPLIVTVSSFVPQKPGITLLSTDIQVRTAPKGLGTLTFQSSVTLTIPSFTLVIGTVYYIRVRHRTANYTSLWSLDCMITTAV